MSAPSHERRRFQRIPFEAEVELRQDQACWTVRLHDLSLKGLLVSRPDRGRRRTPRRCRPACASARKSRCACW